MRIAVDALAGIVWLATLVALLPMAVLAAEALASLLPARRLPRPAGGTRPRCVVLIPAHDEETGIGQTLATILPQLQRGDRVLVVADNCSDRTAEVARAAGAVVIERSDPLRRGKGFALDYGVRFLRADPPAVVVCIDADCALATGSLDVLVREADASGRPVQALYVMVNRGRADPLRQLAAFAFFLKNVVRPLGLQRLGLPCLLTGSGMALPSPLLERAFLATSDLVEDMRLGIELAAQGYPPQLCRRAMVCSELPSGRRGAVAQRTRWEHGHLTTIATQLPRLLRHAFRTRQPRLLGLTLELSVPPLSLLLLGWGLAFAGAVMTRRLGGPALPAVVLATVGVATTLAIFSTWLKFFRRRLPLVVLLAAPWYILKKMPIYIAFLFRRQTAWVRTQRGDS